MVVELIKYIHVDNAQNRNIYIPSHKEALLLILQDQKWQLADKKEIINKMIFEKSNLIQDAIDDYGDKFTTINPTRSQGVLNLCSTDDIEKERIRRDVRIMFMNNSDLVKDTYEQIYGETIKK